jgi:hypothetical protein
MSELVICNGAIRCKDKIPGFNECDHSVPHKPIRIMHDRCDAAECSCSRLHGKFICVTINDPECGDCEDLWQ